MTWLDITLFLLLAWLYLDRFHQRSIIQRLVLQVNRLVSDAESEKETRKRTNDSFDSRIRNLEIRPNDSKT